MIGGAQKKTKMMMLNVDEWRLELCPKSLAVELNVSWAAHKQSMHSKSPIANKTRSSWHGSVCDGWPDIFTAERYKSSGRTYLNLAGIHSSQRQDKAVLLRVQDEEGYHCSEVWLAWIVTYVFGVHWFPDLVLLLSIMRAHAQANVNVTRHDPVVGWRTELVSV